MNEINVLLSHPTILAALVFSAEGSYPWWNYPGLELWKFVNLTVFVAAALYLHRRFGRPIREALRSRAESIKRELVIAREERDRAVAKLVEVEARFQTLDSEVATIKEKARIEAEEETERIRLASESEVAKIREQARREIESASKAARHELRRFAAEESVRLAETLLTREIGPEDDARLTSIGVKELGRTQV